ncbi:MAG: DUF364 domain-containing protein [Thermodesulfobacteriota bacterium]|nr:DUF364 domain-containing protein [Thermodesulfobacteriota bacterium]
MYRDLKEKFLQIIEKNNLESEEVEILVKHLNKEDAIGDPLDKDYPLVKGRERLLQANFCGSLGQAFTDMYDNYNGSLFEILQMDLTDNYKRAIFISTLNAVMRYTGLVERTIHCRNDGPVECSRELVHYIKRKYNKPRIALVGLQPRMAEGLARNFELKITDLDNDNIGKEKYGVKIEGPEMTEKNIIWCDLALVTGTTLTNGTMEQFSAIKKAIFYGVTIAGVANLLGLEHFCPYSQ